MIIYAAVNTPGLRNGNWTRKAKTQGAKDGGGAEPPRYHARVKKKRTVPNTSQWGVLMFDSWMIPRGDLLPPPTETL